MDYFQNSANKPYQLPGISFYMNNTQAGAEAAPQAVLPQSQQIYDQYFANVTDFSAFQQQHEQQAPLPQATRQQNSAGQNRKNLAGTQHRPQQENTAKATAGKEDGKVDPFAPECSIPLPYQLGDEYRYDHRELLSGTRSSGRPSEMSSIDSRTLSYYGPTAVWKRNERERHRVRCVNDGYEKLRSSLPLPDKFMDFLYNCYHTNSDSMVSRDKRLSKVETLRFAIRYIQHLEKMLADSNHDAHCDCDFTVRSSSVSDSCQSPATSSTEQRESNSPHEPPPRYVRRRRM